MYIFKNFPEYGASADWNTRSLRTGSCFDVLLHHQLHECPGAFAALAEEGIVLGDGLYILLLFETDQPWMAAQIIQDRPVKLLQEIFRIFQGPFQLHLLLSDGFLYGLMQFVDEDALKDEEIRALLDTGSQELAASWNVRMLVSSTERGPNGIFHAANSLRHGMEYMHFMDSHDRICYLDIHQQTVLGNGQDTDTYQRLSALLCEQMDDMNFDQQAAAHQVLQTIISRSSCSIEALHSQMQTFTLIFQQTLKNTMLVDLSFLENLQLTERFMEGDRAQLFENHLAYILQLLHNRRLEIRQELDTAKLQRVRTYVEQNISSFSLSVSEVADYFHVNRSILTRQFRTCFGLSLADFILQTRLNRARLLLESHPQRNMEQIAQDAGYASVSTMYRAFQKQGLVSPAVYQRQMAAGRK